MDEFIWIDCCECGQNVLAQCSELDPVMPSDFRCDDCLLYWVEDDD
jgi:hypothetical protein